MDLRNLKVEGSWDASSLSKKQGNTKNFLKKFQGWQQASILMLRGGMCYSIATGLTPVSPQHSRRA